MHLRLKSYAKLNLYLEVLNKRKDNYHNIISLFERIDLSDTLIFTPRRDNLIKVHSTSKDIPLDSSNLVCRSAALLQRRFKISRGVNIRILKRIPVGAGMGGGSSNAAYTLLGLNRFWKLGLSVLELSRLAGGIGSDVAFFVHECRFALGSGRGEKIKALGTLKKVSYWHLIVVPKLKVSTPLIYDKWSKFSRLTMPGSNVKMLCSVINNKNPDLLKDMLRNDLEPVTFSLYPKIKRVKDELKRLGAKAVLMSGSGSSVFAVVKNKEQARILYKKLKMLHESWLVFIARTV